MLVLLTVPACIIRALTYFVRNENLYAPFHFTVPAPFLICRAFEMSIFFDVINSAKREPLWRISVCVGFLTYGRSEKVGRKIREALLSCNSCYHVTAVSWKSSTIPKHSCSNMICSNAIWLKRPEHAESVNYCPWIESTIHTLFYTANQDHLNTWR